MLRANKRPTLATLGRLRPHESDQGPNAVDIGGAQCPDKSFTDFARADPGRSAPGERDLASLPEHGIGHQARVTALAVGEGADQDKLVVEARDLLIKVGAF